MVKNKDQRIDLLWPQLYKSH